MLKFGTKNALVGYFWATILKNYCDIWNKQSQICLVAKFCEKTKMAKFGSKNAPYLGIFILKLKKNIVIFEISTLKFV